MNNPLINIIVPIYEVEHYLCKCIDSILAQTYTNLRIILVDDGSPDQCPAICDDYSRQDQRIIVIHKVNGGLSSARNSGLDALNQLSDSKGEFITFIDGDDFVEKDYIEFLYNLLINNSCDISQCGQYIVYSHSKLHDKKKNHETIIINKLQALESLCYNGVYGVSACGKLYKLKIFDSIRFPNGVNYEDTASCHFLAEKAEKISINMTQKYYYIQRNNSIANGIVFNEKKLDFITVGDCFADYVTQQYPSLSRAANVKRAFVRLSTLAQMTNCNYYNKELIKTLKHNILKYHFDIIWNFKASNKDKIGVVLMSIGFPVFRFVWKRYYKTVRKL
jgi:glycosyltransferase involved in cell wall biosynthesis